MIYTIMAAMSPKLFGVLSGSGNTANILANTAFFMADIDGALSKGGLIIFKIAFLVGCILVMYGGWAIKDGSPDKGKMAIVGGLVMACAAPIMEALFGAGGMDSAVIKFQ